MGQVPAAAAHSVLQPTCLLLAHLACIRSALMIFL
jgi:hypothetical protein